MLYQSDSFVVVQVELPAEAGTPARGGYEIVDKFARTDIWLEGVIAESFRRGVQELVEAERGAEDFDDFIAGYARLAQHPLTLH
ncbi:BTH_I0359 family protein [Rubrivivax gelatinosus]